MSKVNDFFGGFQVSKPEVNVLSAGVHVVHISKFLLTDASRTYSGELKTDLKPWVDVHPQLAVTYAAVDGRGVITDRFNTKGNLRYDELTEAQRKSGRFENVEGYACITNNAGELERVESPERTTQCHNILNKFAQAAGLKEGENLIEGLNAAIAEKRQLTITVSSDTYEGKDQLRVTRFTAAKAVKTASSDFEA